MQSWDFSGGSEAARFSLTPFLGFLASRLEHHHPGTPSTGIAANPRNGTSKLKSRHGPAWILAGCVVQSQALPCPKALSAVGYGPCQGVGEVHRLGPAEIPSQKEGRGRVKEL